MSGDDLRRANGEETAGGSPDERLTPLVGDRPERRTPPDDAEYALPDALGEVVGGDLPVDDGLVTESLDEILLALILSGGDDTHGTGLMEDLEDQFGVQLSPGTVYPRLHELEADGVLDVHELVQTKQYSVTDRATAEASIESAVRQHLAIGMFLQASLDAANGD